MGRSESTRQRRAHIKHLELLEPAELVPDLFNLVVGEVERAQVLLLVPCRAAILVPLGGRHAQVRLRGAAVVRRVAVRGVVEGRAGQEGRVDAGRDGREAAGCEVEATCAPMQVSEDASRGQ